MLSGVPQGWQRGGPPVGLCGSGRQGAIGSGWISTLRLQFIPQEPQEELLERLGVQSSGIICRCIFDQVVVFEGFGDARKGGDFEAELGDSAKQKQTLELRVRCRRSRHAPNSTSAGAEVTVAPLDKMNRRHDLRLWSANLADPSRCIPRCAPICAKHIPADRARRSRQFERWSSIASMGRVQPWGFRRTGSLLESATDFWSRGRGHVIRRGCDRAVIVVVITEESVCWLRFAGQRLGGWKTRRVAVANLR